MKITKDSIEITPEEIDQLTTRPLNPLSRWVIDCMVKVSRVPLRTYETNTKNG